MNFKNIFALSALIWIISTSLSFGQENSYSLKEAQDYAVENSYTVKSASLDAQIARKKVMETLAQGFPQIDGSIDYTYNLLLPTSLIPGEFLGQPGEYVRLQFGTANNATVGATLNQLIFG